MFLAAKTMPGYAGAAQFEHSGTMRTPPLSCAPNASTALTPVAGLFLAVQGIFLDMMLTHSTAALHLFTLVKALYLHCMGGKLCAVHCVTARQLTSVLQAELRPCRSQAGGSLPADFK